MSWIKKLRNLFGILLTLTLCLGLPSPKALAGEEALAQRLLDLLVQKGVLDNTEADGLLKAARITVKEAPSEVPPLPEGEFEFDFTSPDLAPPPASPETGLAGGAFSNLNFGGTFDSRWRAFEGVDIPGEVVHINELVMTTNIGEHISFLGEWLLQTNDFVNNVADDHGFAYAIFSDLPFLPKNSSIKVGRFRTKYGIDAVLDAPLNPLYTQIKKNLGFASDLGVEFDGYFDPLELEYTVAIMNGPDNVKTGFLNSVGLPGGFVRTPKTNNSLPVIAHVSREFEKLDGLRLGLSYFEGRSWPFISGLPLSRNAREPIGVQGGAVDGTTLVYKRRGSVDFSYRVEALKTDLAGEFTLGRDKGGDDSTVRGFYLRADRPLLPNKLDLQVQFDRWDDGRSFTNDGYNVGIGLKYKMTDVAFLRATYSLNDEYDDDYVLQVYLPF